MKRKILVDARIKSKIEELVDMSKDENNTCFSVKFKDCQDTFWFGKEVDLYNFLGRQVSERFYDKELRQGFFDYLNENNETIRYFIEVKRGTITSVRDENLGTFKEKE